MSGVNIEIVRDPNSSDDGEAVIRLVGLKELPSKGTFRIDPIDEDSGLQDQAGWPSGNLTPRNMRLGEDGVELVVGPEVVDAPLLAPGTPVIVSVPSASVSTEMRWPSLPAARPKKRNNVIVSAEQRRAEIAARAAARRIEIEKLSVAARNTVSKMGSPAVSENRQVAGVEKIAVGEGLSQLDVRRKAAVKLVPTPQHEREALLQMRSDIVAEASSSDSSHRAAMSPPPAAIDPPIPDFYPGESRHAAPRLPQSMPPPLPSRSAIATRPPERSPQRTGDPPPLPVESPKFLTRGPDEARRTYGFQRAFGLGFVVAAGLAAASLFAMGGNGPGMMASTTPPRLAVASSGAAVGTELSSILDVGNSSARGQTADGINLTDALKRADESLYGASGDKEEAKYWLRKSLSLGLGDARMVWAFTQLGTLYATPPAGAQPDYAAARVLWELASAKGDPVALCFLASLHEHGLGAPADASRALGLYRRAKVNGGCRDVDQSIARLSKEKQ